MYRGLNMNWPFCLIFFSPKKCSFCAWGKMIFFSCNKTNSVSFEGMGVVAGEGFGSNQPLSPWLCVWFPFWTYHAWCLRPDDPCCLFGERDTGPKLNLPFVCPHETSLPAWQNTGLRLRLRLSPLRNWEWERLEAGAGGGVRWQFLMHCWFLTDHKSNC